MTAPAPGAQQAAEPAHSLADSMLTCEIAPRPLAYPLSDYHRAGRDGPLHYTWIDKPHRLLYDLIGAVRFYAAHAQQQPSAQQTAEPQRADDPHAYSRRCAAAGFERGPWGKYATAAQHAEDKGKGA